MATAAAVIAMLGVGLGVAALFVGIVYLSQQMNEAWLAALRRVAQDHNLVVEEGTWLKSTRASATHGARGVIVDTYTVSTGKSSSTYTRIRVWGDQPRLLKLSHEGMLAFVGKAFGATDHLTGDDAFDEAVILGGEARDRALSRLDAQARAAVLAATAQGAKLDQGGWTLTVSGRITDAERLTALTGIVIRAADALVRTDRGMQEGLGALISPAEPAGVRVRAARALGDVVALRQLLSDAAPSVRRIAAIGLAERGVAEPDVQDVLVSQLAGGDPEVLTGLGAIGTVDAVAPLRALADKHVSMSRVARDATQAIRTIQGRLVGAEAGSLAVVDVGAGELSEAGQPVDAGRLAEAARSRRRQEQ